MDAVQDGLLQFLLGQGMTILIIKGEERELEQDVWGIDSIHQRIQYVFLKNGLLASKLTSWPSPTQETCRISAGFSPATEVSFQVTLQRVKCKCVQMLYKHALDGPLSWRHIEFHGPYYIDLVAWYSVSGTRNKEAHILVHSWQNTSVGGLELLDILPQPSLPHMNFMLTFAFYWINRSRVVVSSWIFIVLGIWNKSHFLIVEVLAIIGRKGHLIYIAAHLSQWLTGSLHQIYINGRRIFQVGEHWG